MQRDVLNDDFNGFTHKYKYNAVLKDVKICAHNYYNRLHPYHGELTEWAKRGVLLLNTVLTVREHEPNSHRGIGWENFTTRVISELNNKTAPVVFLLWGANARSKAKLITNPIHVKLETVHPSPLSAYNGFFGCRHFSKANRILSESGQAVIDWQLPQ